MCYVQVYSVMSVRDELEKCEYLCSEASLSLLPEYHCRNEYLFNNISMFMNLLVIDLLMLNERAWILVRF